MSGIDRFNVFQVILVGRMLAGVEVLAAREEELPANRLCRSLRNSDVARSIDLTV